MSNVYCTIDQLFAVFDRRTMLEQSGDDNSHEGQLANIQTLLDMQASQLDSVLQGRYGTVPLTDTVPAVLSKWVAVTTAARLFARRNDIPQQVRADLEWAEGWMKELMDNKVGLPGVSRHALPDRIAGHRLGRRYCGPTHPADCD